MGQPNYANGFKLTLQPHALSLPKNWKTSQVIFVNSMSDLFHKDVPLNYIQRVFEVMNEANHHIYQVLTKRSRRLASVSSSLPWSPHIWMGVSVESEAYLERIDDLRETAAYVKFLSLEPLLGPLSNLNLEGINWVIVGGESGPRARPMRKEWVVEIRTQCQKAQVPFFFKQWGGTNKKRSGRVLDDRTWDEMPQVAAVA
jgi:protein gp37